MDILADENVETEWVGALQGDGHDVDRVVDLNELGVSAADVAVLDAAIEREQVLLTADQSDFSEPSRDDHHGIVIIADVTRSGGDVRRAVRRLERSLPELSGSVAYVSDWL